MNGDPLRGEVWIVRIDKRRPAIVLSAEAFAGAPKLLIVPLTSQLHREALPATVRIPKGTAGLSRACVAQAAEIQPIWKADLIERLGRLPADHLAQLEDALRLALGL